MHSLPLIDWTPDRTARQHAPAANPRCRRVNARRRAGRLAHSGETGGWKSAVGMWLVEVGLALAVRD